MSNDSDGMLHFYCSLKIQMVRFVDDFKIVLDSSDDKSTSSSDEVEVVKCVPRASRRGRPRLNKPIADAPRRSRGRPRLTTSKVQPTTTQRRASGRYARLRGGSGKNKLNNTRDAATRQLPQVFASPRLDLSPSCSAALHDNGEVDDVYVNQGLKSL